MAAIADLKIPVFWAEGQPDIPKDSYRLKIGGRVSTPLTLDLEQLKKLSTDRVSCRLTSVTRWSVRLEWSGILLARIARMVSPAADAPFVRFTSWGGEYFTVVDRAALDHPRAIVALAANGEGLPIEYGGPVRVVFPQLWGYKSAKSIIAIDFQDAYESGYWETRGYEDDAGILASKIFDVNSRQTRHHPGGEVTW